MKSFPTVNIKTMHHAAKYRRISQCTVEVCRFYFGMYVYIGQQRNNTIHIVIGKLFFHNNWNTINSKRNDTVLDKISKISNMYMHGTDTKQKIHRRKLKPVDMRTNIPLDNMVKKTECWKIWGIMWIQERVNIGHGLKCSAACNSTG